jgi:GR25 family glycosyltransferase involved in LPS biosynthesis
MKINDIVDKVYCINLEKRIDRWTSAQKQFYQNDISVSRFEAIDGNTLNKYPSLARGAAGCLESHLLIINDAILNQYNSIAIFEDDVFFVENFNEKFSTFYSQVPEDWQFIYFANNKFNATVEKISDNVEKICNGWSTHAMMLRGKVLKDLPDIISVGNHPVDVLYGIAQKYYPAYTAVPSLAGQIVDRSDVEGVVVDYNMIYGL